MSKNFFRKVFSGVYLIPLFLVGIPSGAVYAEGGEEACDTEFGCPGDYDAAVAAQAAANATPSAGSELTKDTFKFNPNSISPTTTQYNAGTGNIKTFLNKVANILLIVVSTGAVLSIVIGGFYMAISGGDSEKANKGKIIITYNIIAICIALLSYGIIQFVTWIIWT